MSQIAWVVDEPIEYAEIQSEPGCPAVFAECRIFVDIDSEILVRHEGGAAAAVDLAQLVAGQMEEHPDWIVNAPRWRHSYHLIPPVGRGCVGECTIRTGCDSDLTVTHRSGLLAVLRFAQRIVHPRRFARADE